MAATTFSLRTDAELRRQSELIFNELGMSLTAAINAFLKQSVRVGGMPFDMRLSEPNRVTVLALAESDALLDDPKAKAYGVEEALEELKR